MRETDKYMRATDVFGAFVYVERMEVWRNTLISRTKEKEINSNETKSEWVSEGRDGGGGKAANIMGSTSKGFWNRSILHEVKGHHNKQVTIIISSQMWLKLESLRRARFPTRCRRKRSCKGKVNSCMLGSEVPSHHLRPALRHTFYCLHMSSRMCVTGIMC